jgi:hypothetical protein
MGFGGYLMAVDIKAIGAKIKEAEENLIRSKTKLEAIEKKWKEDYDLSSIEEVDTWIEKKEAILEKKKATLASKKKELEEGYDWT